MDAPIDSGKSSHQGSPPSTRLKPPGSNEAVFRSLFEQAPFNVGLLSPDGRVIEAGRGALEACVYTEAEVLGKLLWETAWWRDSPEVQTRIKGAFEAAQHDDHFQATLPYLTSDGTARGFDCGLSPAFDHSGELEFVIAFGTDVTERVRSQAELCLVQQRLESAMLAAEVGTYRFGGLGLGLAIAQRFVKMHGGRIEAKIESRDQGSPFTTVLPLHQFPPDSAPKNSSASATVPLANKSANPSAHILLVEDHEATRVTLEHLLRRRNYTVVSAGSLDEARQRAQAERFDLVISDVGLPDGDGAVLMAELRDHYQLRGIALTGFGMEEDIARCRAAGFVAHLTKPIRLELLQTALREIFADPKQSSRETPADKPGS